MKKNKGKALAGLCIAACLSCSALCSSWAAETEPAQGFEGSPSRVITAGTGATLAQEEPSASETAFEETDKLGESLGMFTTTGYCNCESCSGGHGLTYSGTVPQANHTISADLDRFPIGTRLSIDGIIYTVEDMGSAVKDNWIDIYYATHQEAVDHGMQTQEVFQVLE